MFFVIEFFLIIASYQCLKMTGFHKSWLFSVKILAASTPFSILKVKVSRTKIFKKKIVKNHIFKITLIKICLPISKIEKSRVVDNIFYKK